MGLMFSSFEWDTKLILPMDGKTPEQVDELNSFIAEHRPEYVERILTKYNDQLFRIWADWVNDLSKAHKFGMMQDPKLHDIPPTVANGMVQLADSGLADNSEYITIHASGGEKMIRAAVEKKNELWLKTKILAVTVLTTLWESWAQASFDETAKHGVLKLAKMALENWADGIVCSPLEAPILRAVYWEKYPNFEIVTPGIRFDDSAQDHQTRRKNPSWAIRWGSTDLVMGSDIMKKDWKGWIDNEKMLEQMDRFFTEIDGIVYEAEKKKYEFEKLLYTWEWREILEYIGAFYNRPEEWKYARLASGLLSNGYINIWAIERNYLVLEKATRELSTKLFQAIPELRDADPDKIDDIRSNYVSLWAQMWSVRASLLLAEKMGIEESIYTEKETIAEQKYDKIEALKIASDHCKINEVDLLNQILEIIEDDSIDEKMLLKRHNIDLKGKKVILSEDIVTKWTTLAKMIQLVEDAGGEVVAITCVGKRYENDNFNGIPLIYCYEPDAFELYWDENTPEKARGDYPKLPDGSEIAEKPKNEWDWLVESMRK